MASENVTKEWTFEPIVSSGGVTKRTAVGGEAETSRPEYPPKSTFRFESYRVRLAKDEREVDAGEDFSFVSGTNAVVPGFEIAAASMRPGERASFRVRFEEAYGTKGHAAAGVPPYADLLLDLHLRTVDAPDSSADDEGRLPELEDRDAVERRRRAEAARGANERNSERAVVVDGEPVKIDGLGPMVLNKYVVFRATAAPRPPGRSRTHPIPPPQERYDQSHHQLAQHDAGRTGKDREDHRKTESHSKRKIDAHRRRRQNSEAAVNVKRRPGDSFPRRYYYLSTAARRTSASIPGFVRHRLPTCA